MQHETNGNKYVLLCKSVFCGGGGHDILYTLKVCSFFFLGLTEKHLKFEGPTHKIVSN